MSHYKPYPAYKDSGVEWLGRVPEHWEQVPLKWVFDCLDGMRVPLNAEQRAEIPGDTPYWGSGGVVGHISKHIFEEDLVLLGEDGAPFFDKDRPVAYEITGKSWINNHIHVLRSSRDVPISWLVHYLNSVEYRLYIDGSTRDKLTQEDMKSIVLLVPPKDEALQAQKKLDRETTRIDTLIAKKTRFIELLKEKRQALIIQAVTKGLDPNVKMKDSRVEWLGEVPDHWGVVRVKHASRQESGHTPDKKNPDFWVDCQIPWVSLKDADTLRNVDYIHDTDTCINERGLAGSSARILPKDTVVFTRDATVGLCAITARPMAVSQHLIGWVSTGQMNPGYLLRVFEAMKIWLESLTAGATIKTIGMDDVGLLSTPYPSITEQVEIAAHIQIVKTSMDRLIVLSESSITLLKERRSALITAAVTGQIDLREAA